MLTEVINTYGAQIIGSVLVALFGILGMAARNLAAKYLDTDTKRTLAKLAVQFAEQTCKDLHGEKKLNAALGVFSTILKEQGIRASETEMKVLLEAAVAEFNNVFAR